MVGNPRLGYRQLRLATDGGLVICAAAWLLGLIAPEFLRNHWSVAAPLVRSGQLAVFLAVVVAAIDAWRVDRLNRNGKRFWLARVLLLGPLGASWYFAVRSRTVSTGMAATTTPSSVVVRVEAAKSGRPTARR
jgi:hypothetical protein